MELSTSWLNSASKDSQNYRSNFTDHCGKSIEEMDFTQRSNGNSKASQCHSKPKCGVLTSSNRLDVSSTPEPSNEASQKSHCVAERVEDQSNGVSDIESSQESNHQSVATESSSSPGNMSNQANHSPNTPSDLSIAQSIGNKSDLIQLEKGFFAAPKMPLDQSHHENWESMRAWLDSTLPNVFEPPSWVHHRVSKWIRTKFANTQRNQLEPPLKDHCTLSWEFMYAGESKSVLAPTVIITCRHESHKSQLSKALEKQPWPFPKRYGWRVIVEDIEYLSASLKVAWMYGIAILSVASVTVLGYSIVSLVALGLLVIAIASLALGLLGFMYMWGDSRRRRQLPYESQIIPLTDTPRFAVIEPNIRTTSGPVLRRTGALAPPLIKRSRLQERVDWSITSLDLALDPQSTTTGTTSLIQEMFVPMDVLPSAASGCGRFVQSLSRSLSFTIGGILLIDDIVYGLTTQHTLCDLSENQGSGHEWLTGRDPRTGTKHTARNVEGGSTQQQSTAKFGTTVTERKRRVIMPSIKGHQDDTRSLLDWALIELDDEDNLGNTISVSSHSQYVSVSSIAHTNEFEDCDVLIEAGKSGPVTGWLRSSPVSIQSQNGVIKARQIILDRPLAPGDSGSWVLKDDKLYGHVFARRTVSPIAYMLPIESIFEDIRWCLNANSITLIGSGGN